MALRGGATANLVNGEILLMRGDVPTMTEGVGDAANAIAMELIVHRAREPGAPAATAAAITASTSST